MGGVPVIHVRTLDDQGNVLGEWDDDSPNACCRGIEIRDEKLLFGKCGGCKSKMAWNARRLLGPKKLRIEIYFNTRWVELGDASFQD